MQRHVYDVCAASAGSDRTESCRDTRMMYVQLSAALKGFDQQLEFSPPYTWRNILCTMLTMPL